MNQAPDAAAVAPVDSLALSRERLRQALSPDKGSPQDPNQETPHAFSAVHESLKMVSDVVHAVINPVAQRNPVGLVAGAFLLGGLLVWARPWRVSIGPALLALNMLKRLGPLLKQKQAPTPKP